MTRIKGVVKWHSVSKGYGFIQSDSVQGDIFFHYTALPEQDRNLDHTNTHVLFTLKTGPKGPQAFEVQVQS